jgi:ATP-dependent helicase HrpB
MSGRGAPLLPGAASAANRLLERRIAQLVERAVLREEQGDVLVFLPGAGEIRRVQGLLAASGIAWAGTRDASAYSVSLRATRIRMRRSALGAPGVRKIVLATNIAETSLTIEGVRIVVDSGLVRRLGI